MLLRIVVFICGAVVMSLEMLAFRDLAVQFGNNLHVWGALIGTFIGALSLGYWLGGLTADRWPTRLGIAVIISAAGILTTALVPLTDPMAGFIYGLKDGEFLVNGGWLKPLLASALIYGPTIVLLGMVSPYAVRLSVQDLSRLGHKVGGFYALSSLGSILGTFLTAFYLILIAPVSHIIMVEGLLLLALSVPVYLAGFFFEESGVPAARAVARAARPPTDGGNSDLS